MAKPVLLISTLDTKQEETAYLKGKIESVGLNPVLMDISMRKSEGLRADIPPEQVADAGESSFEEMQNDNRKQIANLTSNILNPFLVSLIMILLLSFVSTPSTLDALKWAFNSIALSVLPVFGVVVYLVRSGGLDAVFTNVRQQRTKVYLIAGLCTIISYILLTYLRAPSMLVAAFTGKELMDRGYQEAIQIGYRFYSFGDAMLIL